MLRILDSLDAVLGGRPPAVVFGLGLALTGGVGILDRVTGPELALSILYLVPVGIVAAVSSKPAAYAASAGAAATWLLAERLADAEYRNAWVPYWNGLVRLGIFLIVASLVLALREALAEEQERAAVDPLTGLLNRKSFTERVDAEMGRSQRCSRPVSVMYIDLDGFKRVNDTLGHGAGDDVLRCVAAQLRSSVRRSDAVGRLGGDEFAVLLADADPDQAERAAMHVLDELGKVGSAMSVGASVGVLTMSRPMPVEIVISEVDRLMYSAKHDATRNIVSAVWDGDDGHSRG
jgi:diguanylate cyclase (GGDEF)-like protein